MSDKILEKYRKVSESMEMELSLDNYILLPDTKIKINIFLKPKYSFKLGTLDQKIIVKLTQFEKSEFQNDDDLTTKIIDNLLIEKSYVKHFPDIISKKILVKDIELEVPSPNNNIFKPTFEFRKSDINIFVRHLLTVEIPGLEIMDSIGVIICKLPEKFYKIEKKNSNIFKDEDVNTVFGLKNKGKISYNISLKKQIYNPKEEIPINICINSTELKNINVESIEVFLQKKIIIYKFPLNKEEKIVMDKQTFTELTFDQKIIKINTQLKFSNKDIPELTEKEIEKYTDFDENFLERDDNRTQLNPSMDGNIFKCEYKIKINLVFDNIYRKTIYEFFIIDIYDLYNINPESIPDYLKQYFLIKENKIHKSLDEKDKKDTNNEEKNKDETNNIDTDGFVVFDHNDFINTIEGKK
jgi:hypothetical protein